MCVHVSMYSTYVCIFIHMHMCVYIHVYAHVYTYTHTLLSVYIFTEDTRSGSETKSISYLWPKQQPEQSLHLFSESQFP